MEEKRRSFIINTIYYLLILGIIVLFCRYLLPYFTPFIIAWIIALIFNKPVKKISQKLKIKSGVVSTILLSLFFLLLATLVVMLLIKLISICADFIVKVPDFYKTSIEPILYGVIDYFSNLSSEMDIDNQLGTIFTSILTKLGEVVSSLSMSLVGWLTGYLTKAPMFFVRIILVIISSTYMVIDYDNILGFFNRQLNDKTKEILNKVKYFTKHTVLKLGKSYFLIMSFTFVELTIGLLIIGIKNAPLISIGIAVCDILPVLGCGTVLIPWGIISLLMKKVFLGIELLILYVIITVIRNYIEPKIVGEQMGISPIVALASMFIGTQMFGAIGLFGCPILISLLKYLNDDGTIKLFK